MACKSTILLSGSTILKTYLLTPLTVPQVKRTVSFRVGSSVPALGRVTLVIVIDRHIGPTGGVVAGGVGEDGGVPWHWGWSQVYSLMPQNVESLLPESWSTWPQAPLRDSGEVDSSRFS